MTVKHVVEQGEHLARIAANYGFTDWRSIWNFPANGALRSLRQNPMVLFPGDEVVIPDKVAPSFDKPAGQRHRFVVKQRPLQLRVRMLGPDSQPLADLPCETAEDGAGTNGEGLLDIEIAPTTCELAMEYMGIEVTWVVGHLDPITEDSGWQARLANMGYLLCADEEPDPTELQLAIEEFQQDHGLFPTGELDGATREQISTAHGC